MIKRVLILVALLAAPAAYAQMPTGHGVDIGAAVVRSSVTVDSLGFERDDIGWNVSVGWRFNRYAAVELAYYSGIDTNENVVASGVPVNLELRSSAMTLCALGSVPLGDSFALFGRVGLAKEYVHVRATVPGNHFATASSTTEGSDLLYGAGIAAAFDGATVRLEYGRLNVDDGDFSVVSLGVVWSISTGR